MDAQPCRVPEPDLDGFERVGGVVDRHADTLWHTSTKGLVIGDEQPVGELDLVGMRALRSSHLMHEPGIGRIRDVEDRRAHTGRTEMRDVQGVPRPHHLHAIAVASERRLAELAKPTDVGRMHVQSLVSDGPATEDAGSLPAIASWSCP